MNELSEKKKAVPVLVISTKTNFIVLPTDNNNPFRLPTSWVVNLLILTLPITSSCSASYFPPLFPSLQIFSSIIHGRNSTTKQFKIFNYLAPPKQLIFDRYCCCRFDSFWSKRWQQKNPQVLENHWNVDVPCLPTKAESFNYSAIFFMSNNKENKPNFLEISIIWSCFFCPLLLSSSE